MKFSEAIRKAAKTMNTVFPMIVGILILISLFDILIPPSSYQLVFRGTILDPIIGAILGSVVAGNPVNSYIISGDLLKQGISLITVTAFLISWVTVGVIQLPAEIEFMGKKFALIRNLSAFILSLLVALLTVIGVSLL